MRRRSTFLAALVGLIVLPVPAQAAVSLNYEDSQISGAALSDGIYGPGDTVDANFAWTAVSEWSGGNGILSVGDDNVSLSNYVQDHPAAFPGTGVTNANPFKIKLEAGYQCGKRVPLSINFAGSSGTATYPLSIPTGVPGPLKTWIGEDYGETVADTETVESGIAVDDDGRVKSVRVSIENISHIYSLRWYDIVLESPTGTRVRLFSRSGDDTQKTIQDVVFSDDADLAVNDPSITQFHDLQLRPDEALSAFDGEPAKGEWKLFVRDVHEVGSARGGFRPLGRTTVGGTGRSGGEIGAGEVVGQVDRWTLQTASATCSTTPMPWFGPDPLIISPSGGTLNAGPSVDPGRNDAGTADGAITKYEWDFDQNGSYEVDRGNLSTVALPPRAKGKYTIGLKVTDNNARTATVVREILVTELPTIGTLTVNPQTPQADELATLTVTATDPDGTIATVAWDFDADGNFEVNGSVPTTTHTWTRSGPQLVRVRVTDDTGATAIKSFTVNISNQPPVADVKVTGATPLLTGVPANFTAAASVDPDGDIVRYEWKFGADPTWIDGGSTATRPYTFDTSGTYDVQVRVTDNTGITGTAQLTVNVTAAPTAAAIWTPAAPQTGQKVTFDASSSSDPDPGGGITNYEWSLDGNTSYEINGPNPIASTTFVNAGRYTVWLRVTDAAGAKVAQSFSVTVTAPPAPGGGGTGGTTTPPPVTTPGGKTPDVIVPDVPGLPPVKNIPPAVTPADVTDPFDIEDPIGALGDAGKTEAGFAAKLASGSKAKAKKIYKKGIAMKLTVNAPGSVVAKPVISVKDAKKLGLKVKKATPIGSGKLTVTKAGTAKFVVKFSKKFQRYVKKGNKTPIVFRAVVTSKGGDAILLERKVVLVK